MSIVLRARLPSGGHLPFDPDSCTSYPVLDDEERVLTLYPRLHDGDVLWILREQFRIYESNNKAALMGSREAANTILRGLFGGPIRAARAVLVEGSCRVVTKDEARNQLESGFTSDEARKILDSALQTVPPRGREQVANDKRNELAYQLRNEGGQHKHILTELNRRSAAEKWDRLGSERAILKAVDAHCQKHHLPLIRIRKRKQK
jgi:hypothetical protein